jgi:hypothetical protein
MARPLSDLQRRVLLTLLDEEERDSLSALAPHEIAAKMKLETVHGGRGGGGRGRGYRVFNPAQRIISPLNGLAGRGLVVHSFMGSGAYELTSEGKRTAEALRSSANQMDNGFAEIIERIEALPNAGDG